MVQLQSNTSRVASCLSFASSAAATLPTPQMLNKQSLFLAQRKAGEEGGTWQSGEIDDCIAPGLSPRP